MGLVVGAYSLLNFQRILHSVFLKFSLFVINLRTICTNFVYVKLATCAETVLGGYKTILTLLCMQDQHSYLGTN